MPGKQVIMVVDDDENIAQLVRLYLEKEGFEVVSFSRGDSALTAFKSNPPALLLLDIMLPGMDGWQVCRAIRQISSIPIIMLSAKDETFDKVLGLELGADDYMTKPFDPKELIARVKAVLRRGQPEQQDDTRAGTCPHDAVQQGSVEHRRVLPRRRLGQDPDRLRQAHRAPRQQPPGKAEPTQAPHGPRRPSSPALS